MSEKNRIVLSLASHTNIGKTTLTRTLLKRDVGEVRDAAHVTEESEDFTLIHTESDELVIWDTPGFGNVAGLLKRLEQEGGALGWLMHEVVDRAFNRALYSSLQAAKNVRAQSDVVLYLVNVREKPEDAGYVESELCLLQALGKPVLKILNQVSQNNLGKKELAQLETSWFKAFSHFDCLKQVIMLDAFTRTWRQELRLIDLLAEILPQEKLDALKRLRARYLLVQNNIIKDCGAHAAQTLWFAAHQTTSSQKEQDPKILFAAMVSELQARLDAYMDILAARYGIQAEGQAKLKDDVKEVTGLVSAKLSEKKTGLIAGAVASAGAGLMADILAGGLTFGGGALLGFLGGYFGGFSYARALKMQGDKKVTWARSALANLFQLLLSYHLLAAIHGRGKGKLALENPAPFLSQAITEIWPEIDDGVTHLIKRACENENSDLEPAWLESFQDLFQQTGSRVLEQLFTH